MKTIIKVNYVLEAEDRQSIQKQMNSYGLSLRQMARNLGVSASYLSDVLNGNRTLTGNLKEKFESQGFVFPQHELKDGVDYKEYYEILAEAIQEYMRMERGE